MAVQKANEATKKVEKEKKKVDKPNPVQAKVLEKKAEKIEKKEEKKKVNLQDTVSCFYIISGDNKEKKALTVSGVDKYSPRKTGVYNVFVSPYNKLKEQQWRYDKAKHAIFSNYWSDKVISEGLNKNLFMYFPKGMKSQLFSIIEGMGDFHLQNDYTKHAAQFVNKVVHEGGKQGWEVVMAIAETDPGQHWEIIPCDH